MITLTYNPPRTTKSLVIAWIIHNTHDYFSKLENEKRITYKRGRRKGKQGIEHYEIEYLYCDIIVILC